jgi:hypothetical protein
MPLFVRIYYTHNNEVFKGAEIKKRRRCPYITEEKTYEKVRG